MINNIRSRKILLSNTAVMLLFFCAMVVANVYALHTNNQALRHLDEHHNQKLIHILKLEEIARERSVAMLTMYMSDDAWERDEQFSLFHRLAVEFLKHRALLLEIGLTPSEQTLFRQAMDIIRYTQPMQNDIVDRLQSEQLKNVRRDISVIDLPAESRLHEVFEQMSLVVQNNAHSARQQAREQHTNTLYAGLMAAAFIFLVIVFLMRKSLYSIGSIEVELLEQSKNLGWEASHDPLTQLLNRRGLTQHINMLNSQDTGAHQHTLLYLDLDDFKPVNDQFGHEFGDKMLVGLSKEFLTCIRRHDTIARVGGDEFVVILEDCNAQTAVQIANKLIDKTRGFVIQNDKIAVKITGCSIGLLPFTAGKYDVDKLLKHADMACYNSKREGKNCIRHHND